MPDTRRTLAALQALLADNTAGDISAQDLRDFLVSVQGPTWLASQTAAASADLRFNTIFTSLYDLYTFECLNVVNATATQDFQVQFSNDGGATWVAAGYYYSWWYTTNTGSSGVGSTGGGSATQFVLLNALAGVNDGISGQLKVMNPRGSQTSRAVIWDVAGSMAGDFRAARGCGALNGSGPADSIRFKFASGNIASGRIDAYGWNKG